MKNHTIVYFPDCRYVRSNTEQIMNTLKSSLTNYRIVSMDINLEDIHSIEKQIDDVLQMEQPELILADGLSSFFAHTISGVNRICVNPILNPSAYTSMEDDTYRELEIKQLSFDRKNDYENNTHCWGIFGTQADKKIFCMLHYPDVISVNKKVDSMIDVLEDTVLSLINSIASSTYTDDYGVTYANYGRTLVKAEYPQFRDVEHYDVPNGVHSIGEIAFMGMNLKSITLPSSLMFIGKEAFAECRSLESIVLPRNIEIISEGCFAGCSSLQRVEIPKSVFTIHSRSFANTALKEVEIPDSIQSIAPDSFDEGVRFKLSSRRLTELLKDAQSYQFTKNQDIFDIDI